MTTRYEGPFANRDDADHVLAQLPPLGGPENADPRLVAGVEAWEPKDAATGLLSGGMVLLGPTGSGKSTAAVHLVRRWLARYEVATSTFFTLASDLADGDDGALDRAKRVRLLVIDDLGKEIDPKNRIFRVLDHRHTRAPTIITTGIRPEGLDERFGGATVRRMFEFQGRRVASVNLFKVDRPRIVANAPNSTPFSERGER